MSEIPKGTVLPEGTVVSLEKMAPELEAKLLAGLRESGLVDHRCDRCTRPYLSRDTSPLCPPCRVGKPDGWSPAFSVRSAQTGSCLPDELRATCALCAGHGVVNWQPFGPHEPPCPSCGGAGQL